MSTGLNSVHLIGNLGKDPEVRYTTAGTAVCNISLAINERKKIGDKWEDHTEWVNVVLFGKTAENAGRFLQKGRQVFVRGRMQTRKYKDKAGVDKYSTEIVADEVLFLGAGGSGAAAGGGDRRRGKADGDGEVGDAPPASDGFVDDDLPF